MSGWTSVFPRNEIRLAVYAGLAVAVPGLLMSFLTAETGVALALGQGAALPPNVGLLLVALLLVASVWALCARVAFRATHRAHAVFGYVVGMIMLNLLFATIPALVSTSLHRQMATLDLSVLPAMVAQLVALGAVVLMAAMSRNSSSASGNGGRKRPSIAEMFGVGRQDDPLARGVVLWALLLNALATVIATLIGTVVARTGQHDWWPQLVGIGALALIAYSLVRWRRASRSLWIPGAVGALLGYAGFLAGLGLTGRLFGAAAASITSQLSSAASGLALVAVSSCLMIVAVRFAARSAVAPRDGIEP